MSTENLNTEPNDIAGNRLGGPVGNTAASTAPPVGTPAPPTSEQLVDAETSVGQGGVDDRDEQENKEANPADLEPESSGPAAAGNTNVYGGNFGNDTQDVAGDAGRLDNQRADASRGEFGRQGTHNTHGGYGNQNREADYEPHNSAEDRYYGGPGEPGPQHNSYVQDAAQLAHANPTGPDLPPAPGPETPGPDGRGNQHDTRNLPGRADARANQQNDNSAGPGQGPGYAADYGRTSLGGGAPAPTAAASDVPRRNQGEDDRSSRGGYDNQGSANGPGGSAATGAAPAPPATGSTATQPAAGEGYGDRGREDAPERPDYNTGGERSGFGQHPNAAQQANHAGFGSPGGSYDDQYAAGQPGATGGSPAQGDYTRQEREAENSGPAAQENDRPAGAPDEQADTAPHRNAGRDGAADE
ncbi:hypothetical protein ACFQ48_17105 [Hymenobacter caeli]|uniref:Translation initiation factor IF-2 n=1 Tax=Hymenobacter caeli TaxID=2735894 RepID=A0ABX2FUB2_9BACT|nr:hypothetical protein [Hymenobacter caeli]NRT20790.1 hypothetical protein [Hymenobacter caeli]